ncbi:MAG: V-type ATPase subunit [Thermanaerothrix sp.]|nr:V-type ATPase subunit [Thermanaerothrix sp.]
MITFSANGERISSGVKAKVMLSNLLSDEALWELLHHDSMEEIAARLKREEGYKEYLLQLPPGEIHRYDLEGQLKRIPLDETGAFIARSAGPRARFLTAWAWRKDSENLKSILRHIHSGRKDPAGLQNKLYHVPLSKVPYEGLLAASSFSQVLSSLRKTPYHASLEEPLRKLQDGEIRSLFNAEMALDMTAEGNVAKALSKLPTEDGKHVKEFLGERWDLFNLYTIYRARFFFQMGPEETMGQLLPHRHRLSPETLRALCRTQGEEAFSNAISSTPYGHVFNQKIMNDDMGVERNLKRHLFLKAIGFLRRRPPSFQSAFFYLYVRELEVEDIITAIEDVRYDYDRRNAALYLSRPLIARGDSMWQ